MSRCAVVLVNFHCASEVAQAVAAIGRAGTVVEIIVVDNSHDAVEFGRLTDLLPPSVRTLDAGGNLGFGRACNLGWQASDAECVFFVNPDVRVLHGCIDALQAALSADTSLAAVAPRQFLDSDCRWLLPVAWLPTAVRAWTEEKALRDPAAARRLSRAYRAENLRLWSASEPIRQRALSGGALMLRRASLAPNELPFDPRFFMYYEDSDLCMRLRQRGAGMAVVPSAMAVHAWRNLPHKARLMQQAARVYFDKHDSCGSPWRSRSQALAPPPAYPGGFVHTPAFSDSVDVPVPWQEGWLLELSPSPMIQPAAGMVGWGRRAELSGAVRDCFAGSAIFGRLSPLVQADADDALLRWWI